MKSMSTFQIVLAIVFIVFAIIGVAVFSMSSGGGSDSGLKGEVVVWGTIPSGEMKDLIDKEFGNNRNITVTYVEKESTRFDRELVEALASNKGPDVILLPQDLILRHEDKVFTIPYESMSARRFKDAFLEEGELYLTDTGILALPFVVDPLIMYWNRDMFSSAGIVSPPEYWDEFFELASRMTSRSQGSSILRSAVALGEYRNIAHAKDILSAMFLQAGDPIIVRNTNEKGSKMEVIFGGNSQDLAINPAESSLRFYTEFANPSKVTYSWNRSLPDSDNMFVSGDLGVYFGFASELESISRRNPHLNFDTAILPQVRDNKSKLTFGTMQGLSILKDSPNFALSFDVASRIATSQYIVGLVQSLGIAPARKNLLVDEQNNADRTIFYDSALISKAWLDPDPTETETIFKEMIENITSGRNKVSGAISAAQRQLGQLIKQ